MEEFVVSSGMPMHKICRNRTYIRSILQTNKSMPMNSLGFQVSCLDMMSIVHSKAKDVKYPYLLVLGDKDVIVSNT